MSDLTELSEDALVAVRDALKGVDDEIYRIVTQKSNRIEVAIDVNAFTSAALADAHAELQRRRAERARDSKEQ